MGETEGLKVGCGVDFPGKYVGSNVGKQDGDSVGMELGTGVGSAPE